ncbi:MAG: 3'(2'),5'-bisphosphate nucleotidase CysQ [Bacteroidales bacterium]|nr:3'(2'),5'-bisphosphate nucleotidase CysQ [Bacteroidales bacterium]MDD3010081.1 3'(2'),5'-bisphosphate nucleotidase CysQ [Bacteroidales bacterium]
MIPLKNIIDIAINAGQKILTIYEKNNINVSYKSDQSPLTEADQLSNHIIVKELKKYNWPILSEEGSEILFEDRSKWNKYWLIDPLDGTKEFINRNGEFTVNIALIDDGVPMAGIVYIPVTDQLYVGVIRNNLFSDCEYRAPFSLRSDHASRGLDWSVLPDCNTDTVVILGSRSHRNKLTDDWIKEISKIHRDCRIESRGSSMKICALAEGSAHYYPRFAPTMEWDTAAADAILRAAGGLIVKASDKTPLNYNKTSLVNPHFIAIGPGMKMQ